MKWSSELEAFRLFVDVHVVGNQPNKKERFA